MTLRPVRKKCESALMSYFFSLFVRIPVFFKRVQGFVTRGTTIPISNRSFMGMMPRLTADFKIVLVFNDIAAVRLPFS